MSSQLVKYNKEVPSFFSRDEFLTPFSSLWEDFFNESFPSLDVGFFGKGSYPKIDVVEEENQMVITADVPGLNKEQIHVEVDAPSNTLSIKGEKREENEEKNKKGKVVHSEIKRSSFCRSFSLGNNIDRENVDAKFENGVLTVTLKKIVPTPKTEPKKIEVK